MEKSMYGRKKEGVCVKGFFRECLQDGGTGRMEGERGRSMQKRKGESVGGVERRVRAVIWNVAGLKKKDEEFWKFLMDYEIIGLVETWVDEKEWERLERKMPEGWKWRCQPAEKDCKKGRAKGGIVTGVRRELEEKEVGYEEKEGLQEREVVIDRERWRFMMVYNREGRKEGLEKMKEVIREDNEGRLVIAGDFNARIGEEGGWGELSMERGETSEKERESKDKMINKQGRDLMEVIEERGWMVLNGSKEGDEEGEWTYEKGGGKSVIDYGIVNWEAWKGVERFEVVCRVESDHLPIVIDLGRWYERGEGREEEERVQDWSGEGVRKFRQALRLNGKGKGYKRRGRS